MDHVVTIREMTFYVSTDAVAPATDAMSCSNKISSISLEEKEKAAPPFSSSLT